MPINPLVPRSGSWRRTMTSEQMRSFRAAVQARALSKQRRRNEDRTAYQACRTAFGLEDCSPGLRVSIRLYAAIVRWSEAE